MQSFVPLPPHAIATAWATECQVASIVLHALRRLRNAEITALGKVDLRALPNEPAGSRRNLSPSEAGQVMQKRLVTPTDPLLKGAARRAGWPCPSCRASMVSAHTHMPRRSSQNSDTMALQVSLGCLRV